MTRDPIIEPLERPVSDRDVRALAALLVAAVEAGEVVSFLAGLTLEDALKWWRERLDAGPARPVVLVARRGDQMVGTVQLQPAWAPNQPHRAELVKLLVAADSRGAGLGTRLMEAAEDAARAAGYSLLTLDAKRGGSAERLYRRLGWTLVGTIPDYALDPDGVTPHDAVFFYKALAPRGTEG